MLQSAGHDPALDLGPPFLLPGTSAEEFKVKLIFDDHLVAAAAQRHINGQCGVAEHLLIGAVPANADGKGGGDSVGADELVDAVQNREFFPFLFLQMLVLHEEQIPVPVKTAQQSRRTLHPVVQQLFNARPQVAAVTVRHVADKLLIVVNENDTDQRPGGVIQLPGVGQRSDVHPVGGGKSVRGLVGLGQAAEHGVATAVDVVLHRTDVLALYQPLGVEFGNNSIDSGGGNVLFPGCHLQKPVVAPDHLTAFRTEHHHGQRGIQHGVFTRLIQFPQGGGELCLHHLPVMPLGHQQKSQIPQGNHQLHQTQPGDPWQRQQGEKNHQHNGQLQMGLK